MFTAIIQARVGSTRLPNKIFADLMGHPLLWHVCNRLTFSKKINRIIIATTDLVEDDVIEIWGKKNNISVFRGSRNDVLGRFYEAANFFQVENIVRITADDPFKDPIVIDNVIEMFIKDKLDFAFNNKPPTFPEGLDTEVFSFAALKIANKNSRDPFEREHVTQYFYRNPQLFKLKNFFFEKDISYLRWTIDTQNDLDMVRSIYQSLYKEKKIFFMEDILKLLEQFPDISKKNQNVERSSMYKK